MVIPNIPTVGKPSLPLVFVSMFIGVVVGGSVIVALKVGAIVGAAVAVG